MEFQVIAQIIATISGVACVYLQTKEKIIAWPLGILSVSILALIFYHSSLYSDLLLHIIFIILNFYGWWQWSASGTQRQSSLAIRSLSYTSFILWSIVVLLGAWGLGHVMLSTFGASMAYYDAFTTSGSLAAQFLLARKIKENWIFWIIVDLVAIVVYIIKGLHIVALLFVVYLVLSIIGYRSWSKSSLRLIPNT